MGHLWFNRLGIYDLMGGAFLANSVKVEKKNKKLNISGYSVLKLPVHDLTIEYFVSTWFSNISLYMCMLQVSLWALNTYIRGDGKRQGLWLQLSFSQLNTLG